MIDMANDFYTYAYLREDRTPYYIGKGRGNRAYLKKREGAKPPKDVSRILLLKQNLSEEEAFRHEIYMIAVFGRKDLNTGILRNRTNGGDGSSGAVVSKETREKIGAYQKSRKRSPITEEQKQKIRAAKKGKKYPKISAAKKGLPSPNKDKPMSDETKQKISQSKKGKPWTEARRNAQLNKQK